MEQFLFRIDSNHDGKVTLAEFLENIELLKQQLELKRDLHDRVKEQRTRRLAETEASLAEKRGSASPVLLAKVFVSEI